MDNVSQAAARIGRLVAENEVLRYRLIEQRPATQGSEMAIELQQVRLQILHNELEILDYQIILQEDRLSFTTSRGADRRIDAQTATLRKGLETLRQSHDHTRRQVEHLEREVGTPTPVVTSSRPLGGTSKGASQA